MAAMAQAKPNASAKVSATASATATASSAGTDTGTGTATYDRPEAGLGQGRLGAPPWVIALCAVVLVLGVVFFFVMRHRRAKAKRGYESVAPSSRSPHSRR